MLFAIDKVLSRLEAINITKSVIDGSARRKDKRLIDPKCLRESFLNSVAHNDWISKVSPSIYVFNNRIEIVSSGGLPNKLTIEEFYNGYSTPRNPELMRVLRDLEYVEQSGYGINKIIETYGKDVFEISENFIRVILPFDLDVINTSVIGNIPENIPENLSNIQRNIFLEIINNKYVTTKELCEAVGVGERGIRYNIKILKDKGLIVRVGSSRKGYWRISNK